MTLRSGNTIPTQNRKKASNTRIFKQKGNQQKVLNLVKKETSRTAVAKRDSHILRIIVSGVAFFTIIGGSYLLLSKLSHIRDLSNSFTMAFVSTEHEQRSLTLVSLRGNDKSIQLMDIPLNPVDSDQSAVESEDELVLSIRQLSTQLVVTSSQSEQLTPLIGLQLGIPIDESILIPSGQKIQNKGDLLNLFDPLHKTKLQSSLSYMDRAQIWKYILQTDASHIESHSIVDGTAESNSSFISHSSLLTIVQKYYSDSVIRKTSPTIALVNTTSQKGLAKQIGDVLNSWGFTVIQVGSEQVENQHSSALVIDPQLVPSHSLYRLQRLVPGTLSYKSDQNILQKYRSQIVLFIGDDLVLQPNDQ